MNTDRRDRVIDWRDEARRAAADLPKLPPAARQAVLAVLASFAREDGMRRGRPPRRLEEAA